MVYRCKDDFSGIYCFSNKINGKKYVGQSISVLTRIRKHKEALRKNKDKSTALQRAWNKYGEEVFDIIILEKCDIDLLDEREKFHIEKMDSLRNGYNLDAGGRSVREFTEATKQLLRESHIGHSIYQIDMSGEIVKEWYGVRTASTALNISFSKLWCCLEKRKHNKTAYGFIWVYKDDYINFDLNDYMPRQSPIPIEQYDCNGNFIKRWDAISQVTSYGFNKNSVRACIIGKYVHSKNYLWKAEDDDTPISVLVERYQNRKRK